MKTLLLVLALCPRLAPAQPQTFEMEAGDLRRTNQAVSATAWTFPLEVQWMSDPCLYEPNTNPLVLPDKVVMHDRARVVALDRGDGHQLWKWQAFNHGYLWNTPAWDAGRDRLYVAGTMGGLYCLRASDGQPQWSVYEGTAPRCGSAAAPVFADDKILYKNGKTDYVCLKPDDQSVLWRWKFQALGVGCTPALDNGLVYVASDRGELGCFNWSDGSTVWRKTTSRRDCFTGAVTLDDTRLYVVTCYGRVDCRLRSNGSLVWSYQMDSYTYGNLSFSNGTLYCTSDDRCVHALNPADGSLLWRRCHSGNFARSAPFTAGGTVFSSGCTGEFYGDDASSGNNVWTLSHGADNSFNDWAYADGYLYVSNRVGRVFCFRSACPACTPTITPTISPSFTDSPTPSVTATDTDTASPTATPSASPTDSPTASPSVTATATPSASPTASPSATATPTATATATPSASPSASPTATASASPTATPSGSPSVSVTRTASPSATPSVSGTASATPTASPSFTPAPPTASPAPGDAPGGLDDPGAGSYIYPNPSDGRDVHVVYRVDGPCKARIRVFQSAGDPAAQIEEHHDSAGVKRCTVPAASFAPGIYFYKVDMRYDDGHHDKRPLGKFICRPH